MPERGSRREPVPDRALTDASTPTRAAELRRRSSPATSGRRARRGPGSVHLDVTEPTTRAPATSADDGPERDPGRLAWPVAVVAGIALVLLAAAARRARRARAVGRAARAARPRGGAAGALLSLRHGDRSPRRSASCSACRSRRCSSRSVHWRRRAASACCGRPITVPLVLPAGRRRHRAAAAARPARPRRAVARARSASRSRSRRAAVVIAQTFVAMPFLVFAVEGALRSADRRSELAAATLGASRWHGLPARHPAARRPRHRRGRRALLHPRPRRVRRDDHVRRLAARA